MPSVAWEPTDDFLTNSNIARFMAEHGFGSYEELRRAWIDDLEGFWQAVAEALDLPWFDRPTQVLDRSPGAPWVRWFVGGTTNLAYACVDRHDPTALAHLWEGEDGAVRQVTYGELSELVSRIAGGLRKLGIGKGDRVGLYLPLTPESLACFYACAKIGAISVPMFSGFGEEPIVTRLRDAGAKLLITADGFERRGRAIPMGAIAEAAARAVPSVEHVVVWPRLEQGNWDEFLDAEPVREAEPFPADHPFFIGYTSGTTGKPKGAVHSHAGFPLKMSSETTFHLDQRQGELLFWLTDMGWIMAPLTAVGAGLAGQPLFLYDGAPDHPTPARVAEMLERHSVAIFGTSPTYVRVLMRRDDHGFDRELPSLRILGSTGEPWNEAPWWWHFEQVGRGRCPIVNIAGGTESGSFLSVFPNRGIKPCSFNTTCMGIDADVYGTDGRPVGPGEVGELVVRQPWPGRTHGFWRDDQRYLEVYWSRWPDLWVHGDWASHDEEGFWWLHGRSDDTMNIAGKRIGPAEIESVLVHHELVAEAAAVGIPDPVKGESLWCFVVLRGERQGVLDELRALVSDRLGKSFAPQRVEVVSALPRTRNAKVLRRAIRAAVTGESAGDLSSLENPEAMDEIRARFPSQPTVSVGG